MPRLIFLFLFCLISEVIFSQIPLGDTTTNKNDKPIIFRCFPESMPQFPGGEMALVKFVQRNIEYPEVDWEDSVRNRKVVIGFTVDEWGAVIDLKVIKSVCRSFDKEALRVMNLLPCFEPAERDGKPVKCKMVMPFRFH